MPDVIASFETYEGKNATEIFKEPFVKAPTLAEQGIKVMNDIQSKLFIYYVSKFGKITRKKNGCEIPTPVGGLAVTKKPIEVTEVQIYERQCYDVFLQTIKEGALKKGLDINNLSDTEMDKLIAELILDAAVENYYVQMWFGDASLVGDEFYGVYDGFFKRITAAVAAGDTPNEPIASMTTPTEAYNLVTAVIANQKPEMKPVPKKFKAIQVTRNIYDLLESYLKSVSGTESSYQAVVNGIDVLKIDGHIVYVRDLWDTTFAADFSADFNNGRVVMNVADESLIVGLDTLGDETKIDSWFSKEQKKQIYEAEYKVGTEIKFEQYLSVAGFEAAS